MGKRFQHANFRRDGAGNTIVEKHQMGEMDQVLNIGRDGTCHRVVRHPQLGQIGQVAYFLRDRSRKLIHGEIEEGEL